MAPEGWLRDFPVGAVKLVTPPDDIDAAEVLSGSARRGRRACRAGRGTQLTVTPDPGRAPVTRADHIREHFRSTAARRARLRRAQPRRGDRLLRLRSRRDPVRRAGHGEPSRRLAGLHRRDTAALAGGRAGRQRRAAGRAVQPPPAGDARQRHPAAGADRRVLADELRDVLLGHPCVMAWLNGHTHVHAVTASPTAAGAGFWQVTTASHIDWPQQARIVEFLATDAGLAIACTVIDSAPRPVFRAAPSRPTWPRWPANWLPTTGRCATRSPPRAARAPGDRRPQRRARGRLAAGCRSAPPALTPPALPPARAAHCG